MDHDTRIIRQHTPGTREAHVQIYLAAERRFWLAAWTCAVLAALTGLLLSIFR